MLMHHVKTAHFALKMQHQHALNVLITAQIVLEPGLKSVHYAILDILRLVFQVKALVKPISFVCQTVRLASQEEMMVS